MFEVDLQAALRTHFNFPAFRPGQEAAIRHVLNGCHTLVVMPTGSGKSLIYQLAALQLPGTTLVISPLVALMKDQVDHLTRRGISATFINSTLTSSEQTARLRALSEGCFKIVLVAPERLRSRPFRDALARLPISLLAVDEAHCLSQWGHDFRPDYLHIAEARADLNTPAQLHAPITLALTATATPRVQDDIIQLLGLDRAERFITGFNRPNLTLEVFSTPDVKAKLNFLQDFLVQVEGASSASGGIIYTGTRRDAEEVTDFVREVAHVAVAYYHGSLDTETRTRVQDAFMAGDLPIVVATNAFGMGIDRPDVRFVLHYTVPGTLEAYYQEAGRAGRDGLPARAILLYSPKDTSLQEFFIENDAPSLDELRAVYGYLRRSAVTRLDDIERATGLPQIKARVAIEQLEIAQAVRRAPDEDRGIIRVEVQALAANQLQAVAAQVQARREHKYRQLEVMVDYAETNACRRRSILRHFGDSGSADAPLCCDNCLSQADNVETPQIHAALSQPERAALIVLDTLKHLKWPLGKGKLAHLLKGSATKDLRGFEYDTARNYAKFAALKLYEVEALIDQLISSGYVKQVGSDRPTLKLSARGETALQTKAAIRVELRHITPSATQRVKAEQEAGSTVTLTEQLLARGLTPDQIAAERGLAIGTIYSHLAQLIAQGQVDVNAVVSAEAQQKIRAAIETIGSMQYLAPIKQRLPEDIDYNVIRCVAEAVKREQTPPSEEVTFEPANAIVACVQSLSGQLHRSTVAKILVGSEAGATEAYRNQPLYNVLPNMTHKEVTALVDTLLEDEVLAVDEQGHLVIASIPSGAASIRGAVEEGEAISPRHGDRVGAAFDSSPQTARASAQAASRDDDPVAAFLSRPHPRLLKGPWLAGWALDFHSRYDGNIASRSLVGDLVFRYKYQGEQSLAHDLATRWIELLNAHAELPKPDLIIPIPPSTQREFDPVTQLAKSLAAQLKIPALINILIKTRATQPQKEMTSLAQKQANVAGAFAVRGSVHGQRVLLIDDLYDSGATLSEVARVLVRSGAAGLIVLTLTKTIHSDA